MPDISSTNANVVVTNYKCYKKKRNQNIGVTNDDNDEKTRNGEEYREKKEIVVSMLFTMSKTTSHHQQQHSENSVVLTRTPSNVDEVSKETEDLQSITRYSHGSISLIGGRRQMKDALSVKLDLLTNYDFFGVYDGHGGSCVAHACRDLLHKVLMEVILEEDGKFEEINWAKVMMTSFYKMDKEVNRINGAEVATIGSTIVVAVVGKEEVIVANCGDSRAVLSRGGVALALSNDHKPDRPDELERIEKSGGKVINWNGHRVLGVLATSRSIGHTKKRRRKLTYRISVFLNIQCDKRVNARDNYLKPYVIPEPKVTVSKRTDGDEFLILASDGLWDVVPNDVACDFTRKCLNGQIRRCKNGSEHSQNKVMKENVAAKAATLLAELAISRGSTDSISIIIV
uniref:protein-serine/threonine phosphatase n=2 Tax=Solanum tuberosum TaxID=4113 RepID=M1BQA8_SOLTU